MEKSTIQKIAIVLFFIMFVYSGLMKITNFSKKTSVLSTKTNLPFPINELGMIGVILLEVIGSLFIVYYFLYGGLDKEMVQKICQVFDCTNF